MVQRPCSVLRYFTISLCDIFLPPALSRMSNHSFQAFPVLALTASSLMRGPFVAAFFVEVFLVDIRLSLSNSIHLFGFWLFLSVPVVGNFEPVLYFRID